MFKPLIILVMVSCCVHGFPTNYYTEKFFIGVRYDGALPMQGGSDRFRHRNNYEPFSVTVSTDAKSGYVIVYLEVSVTVDYGGQIDFCLVRGDTGSKHMDFRITSNHSDFISYSYKTYGVWEEDYKKMANYIIIPTNDSHSQIFHKNLVNILTVCLLCLLCVSKLS